MIKECRLNHRYYKGAKRLLRILIVSMIKFNVIDASYVVFNIASFLSASAIMKYYEIMNEWGYTAMHRRIENDSGSDSDLFYRIRQHTLI